MFLTFLWLLQRLGFWWTLGCCALVTMAFRCAFARVATRFGIDLLWGTREPVIQSPCYSNAVCPYFCSDLIFAIGKPALRLILIAFDSSFLHSQAC